MWKSQLRKLARLWVFVGEGITQVALTKLIYETPVDTAENKLLFKRAFLIFSQKCFFLATSSPNVTPRSLPTLFDIENTRERNWALHVHNFLLEEVEKAKLNNTKSIHGCCYEMLIIYFHETHFGKNPRAEEAQPLWIQYWRRSKLNKIMKQKETNSAGLLKTGRLKAENERLMKKNAKKNHASECESESDWEFEDESESSGSYQESDSEGTVLDELRQRTKRLPNQNQAQQERRSKKKHESSATQGSSISGPELPYQMQSPPDIHDEVIEISSSSDNSDKPSPIKMLVPKAEKVQLSHNEDQPPNVVCQPSQPIVDGMPVYPSQEVYDISSSSEYEQPLIPKKEKADEHDDIPSFDLGQRELDSRVATWATLSKGENEFVTIFKLRGGNFLEAMRYQFMSMVPKTYIDIGIINLMCHVLNKQAGERFEKLIYCVPPEILLFAPVLYSQHWWLYVLDVDQRNIFVIDSMKSKSPTPERTKMNKFVLGFGSSNILDQMLAWAGNPSIFNKGENALEPMYIDIPQQPNQYDCGVYVMKWMELLDPNAL
ncbi:hypothetical protein PIB30_054613 [Stylosanthes scabra]|uniref:Ubiquitin-like protease family profile domain-containing protein n=1 Tax=Stylosanthes scabra TaxID=79078 RepID=A0ABU6SJQ8_9FABA|nr:hypothetical protein [Stylosanthes scabra]